MARARARPGRRRRRWCGRCRCRARCRCAPRMRSISLLRLDVRRRMRMERDVEAAARTRLGGALQPLGGPVERVDVPARRAPALLAAGRPRTLGCLHVGQQHDAAARRLEHLDRPVERGRSSSKPAGSSRRSGRNVAISSTPNAPRASRRPRRAARREVAGRAGLGRRVAHVDDRLEVRLGRDQVGPVDRHLPDPPRDGSGGDLDQAVLAFSACGSPHELRQQRTRARAAAASLPAASTRARSPPE